jgi:hypothetical protein
VLFFQLGLYLLPRRDRTHYRRDGFPVGREVIELMRMKRKIPQGAKVFKHRDALRGKKLLYVPACGLKLKPPIVRRQ